MKKNIIIILSLFLSGCGLFSSRDAESPTAPASNYQPAVTQDQLFTNLQNSFKDKLSQNYIACFVDSSFLSSKFVFTPSSEASLKYPELNADWNLRDEENYFKSLISYTQDGSLALTLSPKGFTSSGEYFTYDYEYSIIVPVDEEGKVKPLYKGIAQFKIALDSRSQWVIIEWSDVKINNSSEPTWSELKGSFY
jgi:hypothetical protein